MLHESQVPDLRYPDKIYQRGDQTVYFGLSGRLAGHRPYNSQTDDFKLWDATIKDIMDAYRELDREGKLKVRFIQQLRLINMQELEYYLTDGHITGEGTDHFKIGAFKLLPDGSLGGRTAALREPYINDRRQQRIFVYDREEFYQLLERAHTGGLQLAMHAIGDRTMDIILDCYEKLAENYPKDDPRFRIIHCQITDEAIWTGLPETMCWLISSHCSSERIWKWPKSCWEKKGFPHHITGKPC